MTLTVTLDFPADVAERLCRETADLSADIKEAYALELFRRGKLSHFELSRVLQLDRFQTDAYLKRRGVFEGSLSAEDLELDRSTLRRVLSKNA